MLSPPVGPFKALEGCFPGQRILPYTEHNFSSQIAGGNSRVGSLLLMTVDDLS
jgi:hypothetical protein